ncbi:MAG: hypothetical protein ACYST6_01800 [Planctomycetota bacterium]|jgi:hypothetical protein
MKKIMLMVSLIISAAVLFGCEPVSIDIKPQSCPNPFNMKKKGVLPVAILGTDEFDVEDVNTASVKLLLINETPMVEIEVEAIVDKIDYNDVSTPLEQEADCNCIETGPDGFMDLVIYFDSQELAAAIEDFEDAAGITLLDMEDLPLALVAELWGNTDPEMYDIGGYDCIRILKKGNRD